jgi:hypothetical protein
MTCEKLDSDFSATILAMIVSLRHFLGWLVSAFHSREDLVLENLALRRQLPPRVVKKLVAARML